MNDLQWKDLLDIRMDDFRSTPIVGNPIYKVVTPSDVGLCCPVTPIAGTSCYLL
jgi:hypothetical protein